MKKLIITLSFLICAGYLHAQSTTPSTSDKDGPVGVDLSQPDPNLVYIAVAQEPMFPGGMDKFKDYIAKNKKQPDIEGTYHTKVFIRFIVEKDGSRTDFKLIRGIDNAHDQEAIQLVKQSPKWQPGMQSGKIVRVLFTVPVSYQK